MPSRDDDYVDFLADQLSVCAELREDVADDLADVPFVSVVAASLELERAEDAVRRLHGPARASTLGST
ncbi:hypothetical protein [Streptomyces albidoflavus]|uniref:hypothetical protein n=1 Tax=Streptomyces albidoflavus TaxID=1886 RepID=UPI00102011D1|nr:hypothetical protein [Streptomyces albidoflavus]RZF02862.1 hypothetical protein C0R05_32120 [Streptomyces albidoflavus]